MPPDTDKDNASQRGAHTLCSGAKNSSEHSSALFKCFTAEEGKTTTTGFGAKRQQLPALISSGRMKSLLLVSDSGLQLSGTVSCSVFGWRLFNHRLSDEAAEP